MTEAVAANWSRVILVCGTCSDRVGGGWGTKGRTRLAKALRRELGVAKGPNAPVGVVESGYLGACPVRAVLVMDAARPDRWLVTRPGTEPGAVLASLAEVAPPQPAHADAAPPASLADWRALLRPGDQA